jgi:DNA polymerase-3 subunit alpha
MCSARIATGLSLAPSIGVENEHNELCVKCNLGWMDRLRKHEISGSREEMDRIAYELSIIKQKNYSGYFLIVEDFIAFAKQKGIMVGPGRGSAAGSMVAYLLGITDVNPMKYHLLFERMLNPERNSLPDIDSDFCYERREEVIQYVVNKYGADKVAHVMAEGTLACNSSARKVLSAYGFDQKVINAVCKTIPKELHITLDEAYNKSRDFKNYMDMYPEQFDVMKRLEGLIDHTSTHAAGITIMNQPVDDCVPCMSSSEDRSVLITQWHKKIIEEIGVNV